MNKVAERCLKPANAKFHFASKRLFFEAKVVKVCLYLAAVVPIVLTFLPIFNDDESTGIAGVVLSLISFCITLATELSSSFMAMHKESAILEHQMFEAEIKIPLYEEEAAYGAALSAMTASGMCKSIDEACSKIRYKGEWYVLQ